MNEQAFELLLDNLSAIKADISELRISLDKQNDKYHKLRNKVVGISVILPFLVSATMKKIDTPPKAVQEAVEKIIKEKKPD